MKSLLKITSFLVVSILLAQFGQAQETSPYKRYFEIKFSESPISKVEMEAEVLADSPFQFIRSCSERDATLIAVSADEPMRIRDMISELENRIREHAPDSQVESIEVVKASESETYCQ